MAGRRQSVLMCMCVRACVHTHTPPSFGSFNVCTFRAGQVLSLQGEDGHGGGAEESRGSGLEGAGAALRAAGGAGGVAVAVGS